jgi:hypothetical protein
MSIELFDPVFDVETVSQQAETQLGSLKGKKVGYIFNQHVSALTFWKAFEAQVEKEFKPAVAHRLYKSNTWASAPKHQVAELIKESDYAIVGVGA